MGDDCNQGPFARPTEQIEQRPQGLHVVSPTVQLWRWLSRCSIAVRVQLVPQLTISRHSGHGRSPPNTQAGFP
jgi:hypothetical protein